MDGAPVGVTGLQVLLQPMLILAICWAVTVARSFGLRDQLRVRIAGGRRCSGLVG